MPNAKDPMQGWKKLKFTASGQVGASKIGKGSIFGGVVMPTAGVTTTVTLYDDTSAVAASQLCPTSAVLTAGQFVNPFGSVNPITSAPSMADGVLLERGLYVTVGGTGSPSFYALYK